MTKKLIPLHDRVVIEPIEESKVTPGGIHIPDVAKEKSMKGKVLFVGPGLTTKEGKIIPPSVKTGDTVLFTKWSGTEVKFGAEDFIVLKESDILVIIEDWYFKLIQKIK